MRQILLMACLAGALGAQAPHRILAVERKGLPPYEVADRIYRLEGGQDRGLRVGHRLAFRHPGEVRTLGHFRVVEVRASEAEARFEPIGAAYPLKGDLACREDLAGLPVLALPEPGPIPVPVQPDRPAGPPPQEGVIFFLPQRADLSPAGHQKLKTWVEAWGAPGRWVVQVPATKALKPALQKQRTESLLAGLRELGIEHPVVETDPRTADGKYDPAWIRHWD